MAVKHQPWKIAFFILLFVVFVLAMFHIVLFLNPVASGIGAEVKADTVSPGVSKVVSVPYGRIAEKSTGCDEYKQIGLLMDKDNGDDAPVILPLFGRRMIGRNDRYEYYTATDKQNMWKVPVEFQHRDCQGDNIGCAEIYDGTDVVVPPYANKTFRAKIYKNAMAC